MEIKQDGNHKPNIKVTLPITQLLQSVRSLLIRPEKGTRNPPHIHIKLPGKGSGGNRPGD